MFEINLCLFGGRGGTSGGNSGPTVASTSNVPPAAQPAQPAPPPQTTIPANFKQINGRQPETVIFYGEVPDDCKANIVRIKPFHERFNEARISGW